VPSTRVPPTRPPGWRVPEIFDALSSVATFSRAEVAMRSTPLNVRGIRPITGKVNINARWTFDVAFCDGLEEGHGRMGWISKMGEMRRVGCNALLARSILAKLSIALSIVENRACLTEAHPMHPYSQISIHPSQQCKIQTFPVRYRVRPWMLEGHSLPCEICLRHVKSLCE
jgi:hypothetical protein